MTSMVVMLGDNLRGPGGIANVACTYEAAGLFRSRNVRYLSNFDGPGLARQGLVMAKTVWQFVKLHLSVGIALAHIHSASRGNFWRAAMLGEVARISGTPYLLHIHSGEFEVFYERECNSVKKWLVRRALTNAAGVICLTDGWLRQLHRIAPRARLTVIPNPVIAPEKMPDFPRSAKPNLLFLGRFVEIKGIFDLLQAMPRVLERHPAAVLVVGGSGEIDTARDIAARAGITRAVSFRGWVANDAKTRCLSEATLVVVPSHFEGFGVTILEAMAYGRPVVATHVGGIPEVMKDGQHGCLVPAKDPRALADAVSSLLDAPDTMMQMGLAGRSHVLENFSAPRVIEALSNYYESILAPPPGSPVRRRP